MVALWAAAFSVGVKRASAFAVRQRFPAQTKVNEMGFSAFVAVEGCLPHDIHAVGSFKRMSAMRASEG